MKTIDILISAKELISKPTGFTHFYSALILKFAGNSSEVMQDCYNAVIAVVEKEDGKNYE